MTRFSRRTFGAGALALTASGLAAGTARAAVPPSGAYFGVYHYIGNANGISGPEALEAKVGRTFAINHCFQPVDVKFVTEHRARAVQDIADGRIPMISWAAGNEARLAEILAGTHDDTWIKDQVDQLAALDAPVLMRFTWEMDLRYVDTGLFTDVWRYVRWKFKAGAPKVEFVWCPTWRAFRETNKADALYPGDSHVDWVAADGYARRNLEKPDYHYRDFNLMFDTAHRFAVDHGKPFMVGETGVNRDDVNPVQAAWLTETHAVILDEFPNLKALVYFHRDGSEEDEHWRVDIPDGGPAQTAFTAMATDPYFSAT